MAGRSATLSVRIVSDASKAAQGFNDAADRTERFRRGLDRASVASAAMLGGIALVAKEAFDSASRLQQAGGAVESVFGAQAAAVDALARNAAQSVGLATSEYSELASVLGSQLKGMGYAGEELTGQTDALIRTGADLAATFGGSTSEAVEALSSLMRGERDPIERYGIALNQAAIDAQVAAMGLDTSTPAAERAAQAQATLALVAQQSAAAQGAFGRESDTAAGAQQRAAAEFENAKAALGEVLLPIVAQAMTMFGQFTGFLTEHRTTVTILVATVGVLAATVLLVNGALTAWTAITRVAAAAQWVWNAAMAANPIMLVVLGIAALVAAVVLAYNKFSWFRGIVDAIGRALSAAFTGAMSAINWVISKLSFIGDAAGWVSDLFSAPATMTVTPVAGGSAAGLFGAAGFAPVRGAASIAAAGAGVGPTTGGGSTPGPTVQITVNGALDPVAVGRQVAKYVREYGAATGGRVAVAVGR